MTNESWTPAPKPGLIPLRPLGFGTVLGKAFAALRHNPKVLFGFAIVVQLLVLVAVGTVVGVVAVAAFGRLDTVRPGSDDFVTILVGSAAIFGLATVLMGLVSSAFGAIVQGVVAADVRAAVLREPATLRALWARVKPAAWRLIGYVLLYGLASLLAATLVLAIAIGAIGVPTGFRGAGLVVTILATVLGMLGLVALAIWIGTKLMLVPSLLVVEGAGIRDAIVRSWRLTRGRFWFAFGIAFVIGAIFAAVSQTLSTISGLVGSLFGGVLTPLGGTESSIAVGTVVTMIIAQIIVIVVQSIGGVVQATAGTLVYIDCRMRYEGLDQDLMAAMERRAAGQDDGADPFRVDDARAVGRGFRPPRPASYGSPAYGAPEYSAPAYGAPAYGGYLPAPSQGYAPPVAPPPPPSPPARPVAAPSEHERDGWAAPGSTR
ncbi:hypothetical protein [uncultured Microbacterium sp.]|uniref:hypothetical protein n=1 Tax=uncultured Microbacterium sp. TaxID=191216 RepID=UPI0025D0A072|nr:hypothetical protein [uncultured Microbacterium sp.]